MGLTSPGPSTSALCIPHPLSSQVPGRKVGSKAPDEGKNKAADSPQMFPLLIWFTVTVKLGLGLRDTFRRNVTWDYIIFIEEILCSGHYN